MRSGLLLIGHGRAFEAACQKIKEEAVAQVREGMQWLSKDVLEKGGHRIEAIKQPDGTFQYLRKKIWSDEKIKRHKEETDEMILNGIGSNLLEDQSEEAKELLEFFKELDQTYNLSANFKSPKDVGAIWFKCLEFSKDSEVGRTFRALTDAWQPPKSDDET